MVSFLYVIPDIFMRSNHLKVSVTICVMFVLYFLQNAYANEITPRIPSAEVERAKHSRHHSREREGHSVQDQFQDNEGFSTIFFKKLSSCVAVSCLLTYRSFCQFVTYRWAGNWPQWRSIFKNVPHQESKTIDLLQFLASFTNLWKESLLLACRYN